MAEDLNSMTPYELGETGSKDTIPFLAGYLESSIPNEIRLAASAIGKVSRKFSNECNALIPALLKNLYTDHPQVKQYILKTLSHLDLDVNVHNTDILNEIAATDDKVYNRDIAKRIISQIYKNKPDEKIQTTVKKVVILANSIRKGSHCIAGRELKEHNGKLFCEQWIRPVSHHGEGEVSSSECTCSDGKQVNILDVVEINLTENESCKHQPENFYFDLSSKWRKIGKFSSRNLHTLVEEPDHLWLQHGTKTDRINSSKATGSLSPFRSIYLIRPSSLHFKIWQEADTRNNGYPKKHRRAIFNYHNTEYDLSITDPAIDSRYFQPFPALNQPPKKIEPRDASNCFLVVSLTLPFHDYHYKVVATVFEVQT